MSVDTCGALGGPCKEGPKRHHKCGDKHKRAGGKLYVNQHTCKYCGTVFFLA